MFSRGSQPATCGRGSATCAGHEGSVGACQRGTVLIGRRAEEGGATVLACLALTGLIGATLLVGQVGVVVVTRHRAQAGADLGALAAAGALEQGAEAGCAQASEIARRMRVRIQACEVAQWDVTVTVVRNVPIGLYGNWTVRAVARAGPVEDGV
ncbi:Rv3654c family TadE-like protein [Nocardia sp. GCM10030253]|uniref:Rv3654c family TadE-like protein n=1 Tax=Nocardia sp. GCM10030253 TaxID=3273404 RepID=UPI0036326957